VSSRPSLPGDQATVSIHVAIDPATAFSVFTEEIDLWWRHGPAYRMAGRRPGVLCFEAGVNGRLFEQYETPSGPHVYEVGRVLVWDPPARLVFNWRAANFADDESTEVEVRFEPTATGTRVTVQHRGWAALRPNHPARHGLEGAAMSRMIGLWWGRLMSSLLEFIATDRQSANGDRRSRRRS
jgi:uncharacterized protein YndB with AHSA1/START domain